MAGRTISMARIEEIQRLIKQGLTDRKIAKALKCKRQIVSDVRSNKRNLNEILNKAQIKPKWTLSMDWDAVQKEIQSGYSITDIWEEKVRDLTCYSNFYKYLYRQYPVLLKDTVTLREFNPGEHAEVDYAGTKIEWIDSDLQIQKASVFVGVLCFSQLIFAFAAEDEKSQNWLNSHRKFYEYLGGVPDITVCDNLKTGVKKAHLYDPDLNPAYVELAQHYNTAIVPARSYHPKDKALAEGAVRLVTRYFKYIFRKHTFTSIKQINEALSHVIEKMNHKKHTRFKVSRFARFKELEESKLKPLPSIPYEVAEWKTARVHDDCTLEVRNNYYSVPHQYRGNELRVKITDSCVEFFLDLNRVAIHLRKKRQDGSRIIDPKHLPANSQAYLERTPQFLLSQAKYIHLEFYELLNHLFKENTLFHLRRAQGFLSLAQKELREHGKEKALAWILPAIEQVKRFNNYRYTYFKEALQNSKKTVLLSSGRTEFSQREISRIPGNPMIRNTMDSNSLGNNQPQAPSKATYH